MTTLDGRAPAAPQPADRPANQEANKRPENEGPQPPQPRDRGHALTPAAARADQVDTEVRLEQATGQRAASPSTPAPLHGHQQSGDQIIRIHPGAGAESITTAQSNSAHSAITVASTEHARAEESPLTSRIVRGLTAMVNQRGGSLTMRLDPPELGSMRVQMTINRGVVTAQLVAATVQAHGLLEKNLAMLRSALESHGLTVERLSVQLQSPTTQSSLNQQHQHQDGSPRFGQQEAHADAGEGQSRGRRERESASNAHHGPDLDDEINAFRAFVEAEAQGVMNR